ncbi:hypothetical protein [Achromobacter sp. Marseille-Q4954]|uniref:hypothetical protein n=1 Tax=Achromobacter sp. Marseille-Q4954 TaxID=2942203 RepID=UPI00207430A7|nr:hypothetical protein [Achromobacter sp. Marseille-Q4954]
MSDQKTGVNAPSRLYVCLSRTWLIGTYFGISWKERKNSLYEILFGIFIGTLPFLLGGIAIFAMDSRSDVATNLEGWPRFWLFLKSTFDKGELLLFAVSLVAPALWLATHESDNARPLPHRRPIIIITVAVCIISSFLFGLVQAGVVKRPSFVYQISLWTTGLSVVNMYLTLSYHNFRLLKGEPPRVTEEVIRNRATSFLEQINASKDQ